MNVVKIVGLSIAIACACAAFAQPPMPADLGKADLYNPTGRQYEGLQASRHAELVKVDAAALAGLLSVQEQQQVRPVERILIPQLTVSGEATLDKPADQMHLQIGVVSDADQAQTAMAENSKTMNDVIAALQKAGLTKDEYSTGQFQIQPRYSHPPRNPQPEWKPTITGYQVVNQIHVKTKKLNLAGDLIETATEAGANNIDSISFDLADRRKHRAEAIALATANAKSDAEALAGAAGQRLVRILQISLDHAPVQPMMDMRGMRNMAMEGAEMAPPIEPGDVTVHANVTIVYEIAQQ
jgi:uncharacterized protein